MTVKIFLLIFLFVVITPNLALADGNEHKGENKLTSQSEEVPTLNDSIYAVDSEKDTELPFITNDTLGNSLSKVDVLIDEDPLTNMEIGSREPMIRFEEKIDSNQKHSQHLKQKQHVEEATHEWVSSNAKGHKVAIGITIIFGLGFIGLSFFRIGEQN